MLSSCIVVIFVGFVCVCMFARLVDIVSLAIENIVSLAIENIVSSTIGDIVSAAVDIVSLTEVGTVSSNMSDQASRTVSKNIFSK